MHRTPETSLTVTPFLGLADLTSLFLVYLRLCSPTAIGVFGYLMHAHISQPVTHAQLAAELGLTHEALRAALTSLEEVNLVDALYSHPKKTYRYVLRQPLTVSDALSHPVLGRAFLQSAGQSAYEALLTRAHADLNEADFERVTKAFDVGRLNGFDAQHEALFDLHPTPVSGLTFNLSEFSRRCSELILPLALRTPDVMTGIAELGSVYGISPMAMVRHVGKVVLPNAKSVDLTALEQSLLKESPKGERVDDPYRLEPVLFLKQLQNGVEPTDTEKRLISGLVLRMRLNPEVVNVLIEHALASSSDKSLKKAYVETIAASWVRLNITTKDQALAHIQTPKPATRSKKRVEPIPDYTPETSANLSETELEALKARLRKLGDKHGKD
jgi:replication initiation and membrane attachment protein